MNMCSFRPRFIKMFPIILMIFNWFLGTHCAFPIIKQPIFNENNVLEKCDKSDSNYRLNTTVIPLEYDIVITPYLEDATFEGELKLKFYVMEYDLQSIVMHSKVSIGSAKIDEFDVDWMQSDDDPYSFVTFDVSHLNMNVGQHELHLRYIGSMQTSVNQGFYRTPYREDGEVKWLGATQMQPIYARNVFPCFDEPAFKATFIISIVCPENYKCESNMKEDLEKSKLTNRTSFYPTPKMSTYLVAFIVSTMIVVEETQSEEEKFRILGRAEAKEMGKFAFDFGLATLKNMDEYFHIPYYEMAQNIKLDNAAIPSSSVGAMENWGLAIYKEVFIMFDPNESSSKHKVEIAKLLGHEISHMWFGNLVTMHWWSDLWLNEGFAAFFQHLSTNEVDPDLGLVDHFIISQVQLALLVETIIDLPPLTNNNVNSPIEIFGQFSNIAYQKGAAFLWMIKNWIGDLDFRNSLRHFLSELKYSNAQPIHLFNAISRNTDVSRYNITVQEMMESWTTKSGFPLLRVHIDRINGIIHLNQEPFKDGMQMDAIFSIPITYTTEEDNDFQNTTAKFIMKEASYDIEDESFIDSNAWVLFNIQYAGYFRVIYDDVTMQNIMMVLNGHERNKIHRYNRAQIIDDAFNLAHVGYISFSKLLDTIQFLEYETDFEPWSTALLQILLLKQDFDKVEILSEQFNFHIHQLMTHVIDELGVENRGSDLEQILRANILNMACNLRDDKCIDNAIVLFQSWKTLNEKVHPNLRESVYCNGLRYGDYSDYDFLWRKYEDSNVFGEKEVILNALGCTNDQNKVMEYLLQTVDENTLMLNQDKMAVLYSAVGGNPDNVLTTFEFIQNNVEKIRTSFGNVASVISILSSYMNAEQLDQLEEWVNSDNDLTASEITSARFNINSGRNSIAEAENKKEEILKWIDDHYNL